MAGTLQPDTGYIPVNGTKLYYEVMGEGHLLVLIHGSYMEAHVG